MEDQRVKIPWDGWRAVKPIGKGGFGVVYEIERVQHGITEKAAMKVISIPQSSDEVDNLKIEGYDEESITRRFNSFAEEIIREYGIMVQMKGNANIVYCDDYKIIQQDDSLGWDIYIKMELLTPLVKALDRVSTDQEIIQFGMDLCNALEACQRRNVIHRDIKPQNIFVSDDGAFKLGDFGIARTVEKTTRATVGIGTYQFMAPEVKNDQPYGTTVDIYSLGLVLYWLLNGRRMPFLSLPPEVPKHGEEEKARQRRFSGEPIPAPRDGCEALKQIFLKACAFESKDRYQTARDMREALAHLAGGYTHELIPESTPITEPVDSPDFDEDDGTMGPVFIVDSDSNSNDEDETVGPLFKSKSINDAEDENKTVSPVFVSRKQQKKNKKHWLITAVVICIIVAIAGIIGGNLIIGNTDPNVTMADASDLEYEETGNHIAQSPFESFDSSVQVQTEAAVETVMQEYPQIATGLNRRSDIVVTEYNGKLYFVDSSKRKILMCETMNTTPTILFETNGWAISSLCIVEDWLFFTYWDAVCKFAWLKIDGDQYFEIEVPDSISYMGENCFYQDGWIYARNKENCIIRFRPDGSKIETLLNDVDTYYVYDNLIVYSYSEGDGFYSLKTYDITTKASTTIVASSQFGISGGLLHFEINDGLLYFLDVGRCIYRYDLSNESLECLVSGRIMTLAITDGKLFFVQTNHVGSQYGQLYYVELNNPSSCYSVNTLAAPLDSGELEPWSTRLIAVGDWLYYKTGYHPDDDGNIYAISSDGTQMYTIGNYIQ